MKRTLLSILLVATFVMPILAQHHKLQNLPYADHKIFHLGFMVGLHTQDLQLTQSGYKNDNGEVWFSEIPNYSPGFSVGLIADLYVASFLNIRTVPALHLGSKDFVFKEQASGEEFKTGIKNNYITIPLQLKFRGARTNNYRPYLITGGYGSIDVSPRKNNPILLKNIDYGIELGIGCDFYLPLFKLSPELKYCFGLADVYQTDRKDLVEEDLMKYAKSISKAVQHMIVLSFNFE